MSSPQCVVNERLPKAVRAEFARLMLALHVDVKPFGRIPVGEQTRLWEALDEGAPPPDDVFQLAKEGTREWFEHLAKHLLHHLDELNGVLVNVTHDENNLTYSVVQILWKLLQFGIINSAEDIQALTRTAILLLDGRCVTCACACECVCACLCVRVCGEGGRQGVPPADKLCMAPTEMMPPLCARCGCRGTRPLCLCET